MARKRNGFWQKQITMKRFLLLVVSGILIEKAFKYLNRGKDEARQSRQAASYAAAMQTWQQQQDRIHADCAARGQIC